jgi:4-hydroxyphenylpyruvate dioxygenase-like putative hemolysin
VGKRTNVIDHVVFIYRLENLDAARDELSAALGITDWDGPKEFERFGIIQTQSVSAGVELLAPTGDHGFIADHLKQHGEGFFSLVYGVEDLDKAVQEARDRGIEPVLDDDGSPLIIDSMVGGDDGGPAHPTWVGKVTVYKEVPLQPVAGLSLYLGEIEAVGN